MIKSKFICCGALSKFGLKKEIMEITIIIQSSKLWWWKNFNFSERKAKGSCCEAYKSFLERCSV